MIYRPDAAFSRASPGICPVFGKVACIVGTTVDITERKRAADALREQRDFLQRVINNVSDLIVVKDRAGYFHMANTFAAQRYGITLAEMMAEIVGLLVGATVLY